MAPWTATPVSVVDHLREDSPIPGQNYAAVSFLSPENVIKDRDAFATKLFLKSRCDGLRDMLTELEELPGMPEDAKKLIDAFRTRHVEWLSAGETEASYEAFMNDSRLDIDRQYSETHGQVCCTRGFKIRGVYDTLDGARARCQLVRSEDEIHDVFACEVGKWLPWNPAAKTLDDVNYMENELNGIMAGYKEQATAKAKEFIASTDKRMAAAKEEGQAGAAAAAAASSSGNVVDITNSLVSVPDMFDAPGDAHEAASKESKDTKAESKKAPAKKAPAKKAAAKKPVPEKKAPAKKAAPKK